MHKISLGSAVIAPAIALILGEREGKRGMISLARYLLTSQLHAFRVHRMSSLHLQLFSSAMYKRRASDVNEKKVNRVRQLLFIFFVFRCVIDFRVCVCVCACVCVC